MDALFSGVVSLGNNLAMIYVVELHVRIYRFARNIISRPFSTLLVEKVLISLLLIQPRDKICASHMTKL